MSVKQEKTIQIFITGGTFDKSYDYIEGRLIFQRNTFAGNVKKKYVPA